MTTAIAEPEPVQAPDLVQAGMLAEDATQAANFERVAECAREVFEAQEASRQYGYLGSLCSATIRYAVVTLKQDRGTAVERLSDHVAKNVAVSKGMLRVNEWIRVFETLALVCGEPAKGFDGITDETFGALPYHVAASLSRLIEREEGEVYVFAEGAADFAKEVLRQRIAREYSAAAAIGRIDAFLEQRKADELAGLSEEQRKAREAVQRKHAKRAAERAVEDACEALANKAREAKALDANVTPAAIAKALVSEGIIPETAGMAPVATVEAFALTMTKQDALAFVEALMSRGVGADGVSGLQVLQVIVSRASQHIQALASKAQAAA